MAIKTESTLHHAKQVRYTYTPRAPINVAYVHVTRIKSIVAAMQRLLVICHEQQNEAEAASE